MRILPCPLQWLGTAIILGLAPALASCDQAPPPEQNEVMGTTVEIQLDAKLRHGKTYELVFRDKVVPWGGDLSPLAKLELGAEEYLVDQISKLGMRIDTNCGPETIPVELSWQDKATERRRRVETGGKARAILSLAKPAPMPRVVYLDNHGGKEAAVTIGTTSEKVAAGKLARMEFRTGSCDKALTVTLEGKVVGELPKEPKKSRAGVQAPSVVDLNGRHCYQVRTHVYADAKHARNAANLKQTPDEMLPKQRIVEAPGVAHILEVPPEAKKGYTGISKVKVLERRLCTPRRTSGHG